MNPALASRLKIILPVVVVAITAAILFIFLGKKEAKPNIRPEKQLVFVSVLELQPQTHQVTITSRNSIEATQRTVIAGELAAPVVWISQNFEPGGYVKKGEVLARLDKREAIADLDQAKAALISARAGLEEESSRASLAKEEWQIMRQGRNDVSRPTPLALRQPQLKAAQAALQSATARLQRSQMILERTVIRAPYNAYVISRDASLGQSIFPGSKVGEVISANQLRLQLPLSVGDAALLQSVDCENKPCPPIKVDVRYGKHSWLMQITRFGKEINRQTRTINALIDIDPGTIESSGILRAGLFVEATLYGPLLRDIFIVPKSLLDRDARVPIFDKESSTLAWRDIKPIGSDGEFVWYSQGLTAGELLVTTNVAQHATGTKLEQTTKEISKAGIKGEAQ